MPKMTQATHDQIAINKAKILSLETPQEIYTTKGKNPVNKMIMQTGGQTAQMQMLDEEGGHMVATFEYHRPSQGITLALFDKDTGTEKNYLELRHDGKIIHRASMVMTQTDTEAMVRAFRTTVVLDTADHNKATRAEAIAAFKELPFYDFTKDDAFYIKDTTGHKMISMKYFADGATDEASAGRFYYRAMSECV